MDQISLPYDCDASINAHDGLDIACADLLLRGTRIPVYQAVVQHDKQAVPKQQAYLMLLSGLCNFLNATGSLDCVQKVIDKLYNAPTFVDSRSLVFCEPCEDLVARTVFMDVDNSEFHMYEGTVCVAVMPPAAYELWYAEHVSEHYPWEDAGGQQ